MKYLPDLRIPNGTRTPPIHGLKDPSDQRLVDLLSLRLRELQHLPRTRGTPVPTTFVPRRRCFARARDRGTAPRHLASSKLKGAPEMGRRSLKTIKMIWERCLGKSS